MTSTATSPKSSALPCFLKNEGSGFWADRLFPEDDGGRDSIRKLNYRCVGKVVKNNDDHNLNVS